MNGMSSSEWEREYERVWERMGVRQRRRTKRSKFVEVMGGCAAWEDVTDEEGNALLPLS